MKSILKIIIGSLFLITFLIPGYTFLVVNQGTLDNLYSLFRFFGLYGFFFIWGQIVIGPFMPLLRRLFGPLALSMHITEGIFAIVFTTLHPLLLGIAYYVATKDIIVWNAFANYLPASNQIYGYLGVIAWVLLVCTVSTALLRTKPWFINKWRYIHFLNYIVFVLIFLHSYNIGSDVRSEPLNTLYGVYGITFVLSVLYRIVYKRIWVLMFRPA